MTADLLRWSAVRAQRRCARRGHDWFPNLGPSEFIVQEDFCLRCAMHRVFLPTGQCLGGHPLADHYDNEGAPVPVAGCPGPQ